MKIVTAVAAIALSMICSLATAEKPNIVYILADDLGYADVGFNGGCTTDGPGQCLGGKESE